jgi:D-alanyl-D-alanine dipeptidase
MDQVSNSDYRQRIPSEHNASPASATGRTDEPIGRLGNTPGLGLLSPLRARSKSRESIHSNSSQSPLSSRFAGIVSANKPIPLDLKKNYIDSQTANPSISNFLNKPLSQEGFVNLSEHGIAGENYYTLDGDNPPYNTRIDNQMTGLHVRESVANKLKVANQQLKGTGLELFVRDGWRSMQTQHQLFTHFEKEYAQANPGSQPAQQREHALKYASDPCVDQSKPQSCPLHATGGAVDVWLRDRSTKKLVDMGTHFDDASERSHTDSLEPGTDARALSHAVIYRRILYHTMTDAGFRNYPMEFWHYDFGNRMYAKAIALEGRDVEPHIQPYGYAEPDSVKAKRESKAFNAK